MVQEVYSWIKPKKKNMVPVFVLLARIEGFLQVVVKMDPVEGCRSFFLENEG